MLASVFGFLGLMLSALSGVLGGRLAVDDLSTIIPAGINFAAMIADLASLLTNPMIVACVLAAIAFKWARPIVSFLKRVSSSH